MANKNEEAFTKEIKSMIPTEIPLSADKEVVQEQRHNALPVEFPQAENVELKNIFVPFDGEWMPDNEPIEIGAKNYKTLQNYRYSGDKVISLESVLGYSKINTTSLSTYNYENIRNGQQLRSNYTKKSYVLVHAEHDTPASNYSKVYQNQAVVPAQGNFETTVVHTDSGYNLQGRFSNAPRSNIAYANGEESCIWAGNEMDVGGFFTASDPSTSRDDIALNSTANPDTITTTNGNFLNYGFKAGQTITVSGANTAGNNGDYDIVSIASDGKTITITDGDLAGDDAAGASTVTLTANANTEYYNPVDYTEAVNNELQTLKNIAVIGGGNDSYTKLLLHCDGADESTTFTDNSSSGHTITANGNAQLDIDQVKFGTAAGLFDGTGDYLSVPDSADWFMSTGKFTIDFWVRFKQLTNGTTYGLFYNHTDADHYISLTYTPNASPTDDTWILEMATVNGHTTYTTLIESLLPDAVVNTWYHIAIIRGWGGNANDWSICIDGIPRKTETLTEVWPDYTGAFVIGAGYDGGTVKYLNGWIDEFRVSKGIARWTANFTPPNRSYRKAQNKWYLLTTRPIKGVKYYVASANTVVSTMTGYEWTGRSFSSLSLTDNTKPNNVSMAATGTVTFSSTVDTCKPWHFEGLYLYAYLFELSAGSADVYHVTVDAPFQDIIDVWDGVYRQPIEFQLWDDSAGYFMDYTVEVNYISDVVTPIGGIINAMTSSDYILIAFDDRTSAIQVNMLAGLVNSNTSIASVAYWTGSEWSTAVGLNNTTTSELGLKAFSQTGMLSWYAPPESDEAKKTQFGTTGYFYKITVSATLSDLGASDVTIDTIVGIPAQQTVKPFKFPTQYKNRLMLCGFTEGKEGNRIDYSVTNAPDSFNGDESSMDGTQSLYVSGKDNLTCGTELFNRFGSNIISSLLLFKNNETHILTGDGPDNFKLFPISKAVGCPAPLTLDAAETGYTFAEEINRNIVIWMSYSGPMIFDGAAIIPIPGIKKYFDPAKSTCIKYSIIERCRGWFDATYKEYNLLIPSGASATKCNVWLVYDLVRKRWFEKVTGTSEVPQCAFPVYDTDGVQYIYAGIDDGNVMRLENGNSWADDSAAGIAQTIETGDSFLSGDMWDITTIRRIKTIVKKITEASKDLAITHYADTLASGTSLTAHNLDAGDPISKFTQAAPSGTPLTAWCHRFRFTVTTSTTAQLHLIGWGAQFMIERQDENDV